jgi:hypothetical protein
VSAPWYRDAEQYGKQAMRVCDASQAPPDRSWCRDRQGPRRLHRYSGGWAIGLRWFWSLTVNPPMARSDKVATLEEAKAQFQRSWDAWKAWANLEEID